MKNLSKKIFCIVFIAFFIIPNISYADDLSNESKIPIINARHAVVIDRNSSQILYGKNEFEKCKMASTTKIMTAIVVIENSNLSDIVTISKKSANTGGSRLGLSQNDKISVENLLYGLMLKSGNDAAVALAEYVGGNIENFINLMNKKAENLNLSSTHFVTPHGLDDENHYTTAFDLAILANYALNNTTFSKIVSTKSYTITINGNIKQLDNTNELLGNFEGIYGVKTGFTNGANRCLVTACKRGELDVICVVLGCDTKKDRTQDSIKLLNYILNNFSVINVKEIVYQNFNEWAKTHTNSFKINKGISQSLDLYLNESDFKFSKMAIDNANLEKISTNISFRSYFEAPVNSNETIGNIQFLVDNTEIFNINFYNRNYIERKNLYCYLTYILKNYFQFF